MDVDAQKLHILKLEYFTHVHPSSVQAITDKAEVSFLTSWRQNPTSCVLWHLFIVTLKYKYIFVPQNYRFSLCHACILPCRLWVSGFKWATNWWKSCAWPSTQPWPLTFLAPSCFGKSSEIDVDSFTLLKAFVCLCLMPKDTPPPHVWMWIRVSI